MLSGFVRGAQPEAGRVRAHLGLRELADREHRTGELRLPEHVEHVRLVLRAVGAADEHVPLPVAATPRVMPGRDGVEPERVGAVEQAPELDRAVALDARVRRATRAYASTYGSTTLAVEVVAEVEDVVRDAELCGHPAGVLDVGHAAAPGVGLAAPELQRDAR